MDNSYAAAAISPTLPEVHWDRLFEDLEGQLASEWETERAALDAESERLRIARLALISRLRVLAQRGARVTLELSGERRAMRVQAVGADWIGMQPAEHPGVLLVPLHAVGSIETDHGMLLDSLAEQDVPATLRERMTLGFVLRDLARRRVAVRVALRDGGRHHGTVDRAGADHFDLAVHDPGEPRRAAAVRAFRIVPFDAVLWVGVDAATVV